MSGHCKTFDWVAFPEGRARFSGEVRGWDERGRETFALELRGKEYFGEIRNSFLENRNDYNIMVVAFGYGWEKEVGMPGAEARKVFTANEESIARSLVVRLIQTGLNLEDPPFFLVPPSHFAGEIAFQNGWMLVAPDSAGEAQ